jgi:beta-glucosidase
MATTAPPYQDAARPIDERVADLLALMTIEEKIAQLGSIWAFELVDGGRLDRDRLAACAVHGLGQVTRVAGSASLDARGAARVTNEIQRYLVEETRLGIPTIVHEESLHGLMAPDAPCFQQSIGAAASWDPSLAEGVATTIRRRMTATGSRHALAPVFDIARDPRWGRIEETYGEDPYLSAVMGTAYVRGLQGEDLVDGVIATGKHMVGHGLADAGLNQGPVRLGPRELHDEQLFPFEAAIRAGGLASVMPAYCDVDGVPCHASRQLLADTLRGAWGFDGIVVSDYTGVGMISTIHRLTDDLGVAAELALRAGVDSELPRTDAYGAPLRAAIEAGRIELALVDAAVGRVLRVKFRLGLFEQPYVEPPSREMVAGWRATEAVIGRRLAERSMVLAENDGVLPLASPKRIAVVGPIADSTRDLLGDYAYQVHREAMQELRDEGNAFGITDDAGIDRGAATVVQRTIVDAIRERFASSEVGSARGCGIRDGTDEELAEAVALAAASDVAIVVLGERSGLTNHATTGEARDRRDLGFLGRQQELLESVTAAGTPVVLVVVSGRPLALEWAAEHCSAVVLAWVPGDHGPDAIAAVLAGDVNPGGKLPISFARHVGQLPMTYRHHPSGGRSHWKGDYVDGPTTPLWPFGFGRSYTSFEFADLRIDTPEVATQGGTVSLAVDVANTGSLTGDEVVQVYVRDEEASVARPVLELRGFARVTLAPGERRTVRFQLHAEQFAFVGANGRRIIEPGRITVSVGSSSAERPLQEAITLVGEVIEVGSRQHYFTAVAVEN